MKTIYVFSGLGADERVFQNIHLPEFNFVHIKWISPVDQKESIEHYAQRLTTAIPKESPIIIGLSFGGIMAVEVAKLIKPQQLILISSAKTKYEIPLYYKWLGILRIHNIVPAAFFKQSNSLTNWLFGAQNNKEKQLLKVILTETDSVFLKWALNKVLTWKNIFIPPNLNHIHGTSDHILPIRFVSCDTQVIGGGHFMIVNKADELTQLIRHLLKDKV